RAPGVRSPDRRLPGDPAQAREHVDGDRRGAPARVPRRVVEGARPQAHRGGGEGQALRVGDGAAADGRGDPGPRWVWLHEGIPRRAVLPRREDHRNLRGDERDPAAGDRPLDPRPDGTLARGALTMAPFMYTRARDTLHPYPGWGEFPPPSRSTIPVSGVRVRAKSVPVFGAGA